MMVAESERMGVTNTAIYARDLERLRKLKGLTGKPHVRLISDALDALEQSANGGQASSLGSGGAGSVGGVANPQT